MSQKVALVTGAAKRTGRVIAEHLGAQGYAVAVHAHRSIGDASEVARGIEARGGKAFVVAANLSNADEAEGLIGKVFAEYGGLDLLVNNAAVFWQEHFPDFTIEQLDEAWAVNCRAPIILTRAFYRLAKAASSTGAVINIVDQKVKQNFHRDHFSYTVGKTAIGNLTEMLAISADPVLRVNAIFPGLMLPSDDQTQADFEYASKAGNLLGRVAGPQDIADAVLLLASPAYNGTDFVVDSGQNLIPVAKDVLYLHKAPLG